MAPFSKTFDFNFRRDHKKKSYERRYYESVDEKGLSYAPKNEEKKKSGGKGLKKMKIYKLVWGGHFQILELFSLSFHYKLYNVYTHICIKNRTASVFMLE